ncbi:hypothetical protein OWR29_42020 [Actinoplanes sp. Pm04-4]|uniref:Uncharacterized protein n=1 Tax=Paractinoplanes pyxinae TaxID=2997416 RepID=A0ABT4BDT2_9ACTN|nr:hypothetical protein [Actinoplanes pyxinae]MCY1144616.1 hypothetical protein [Actinoplanes pyxinae]
MGVQLGASSQPGPASPPAVVTEQGAEKAGQLLGGTGAGEQTSDNNTIDVDPQANVSPLTSSPSAEPSPSESASPEPSASTTSPSPEPTRTTTEPTTPTDPGTTDPAGSPESTTVPAPDPTETTTTPPVEDESGDPTESPDDDWTYEDPSPHGGSVGKYVSSDAR